MAAFSIGDGASVRDFAPIVASVEARRKNVAVVYATYRDKGLPISWVAEVTGVSVPNVMDAIAAGVPEVDVLLTEWSDDAGYEDSCRSAKTANFVVLARSALHTASALGLLETLVSKYSLIAPESLHQELRDELEEADRQLEKGHHFVYSRGGSLGVHEVQAGDPSLEKARAASSAVLEWFAEHVAREPRPLSSIHATDSREEKVRSLMGRSAADAVALSRYRGAPLFADDLGLRRLVHDGGRGSSFSSVSLVVALASEGIVDPGERDEMLLRLVDRRHAVVRPTVELLLHAVSRYTGNDGARLKHAFSYLSVLPPGGAARIGARILRQAALEPIRKISAPELTVLVIEGMSKQLNAALCAQFLMQAARSELMLLPEVLADIQGACATFRPHDR